MSRTAPLSEVTANAVYDILERECRAPGGDRDRQAFVREFTSVEPTREWRFIGALGFGGKIYFDLTRLQWGEGPALWVTCYPEHETPERLAMIKAANQALAALPLQPNEGGDR